MEVSEAKKEVIKLENNIYELVVEFEKLTGVKVSSISIREEFFISADRQITGIKIYTHID